ncbi:cyclodeaminase/cyclohydrolase family protein [Clostridium sp. 19966]|uniref:cyclodeaminase/cyclohydrolase family protein n=1 Tax=Clostridium sp. 19966 TaxID=2768166 RepID=UPI0028DDA57B|nr:cyclodeaminase/cyclohydrolase family protein [Clostridium sp. 19966]MDT8716508.1 cyclodeaminase/cyclohydrolase family protein [Clostridium sp. 19966]
MEFEKKSIKQFIDELASNAPVPGGGGAAALCGALAAALSSMVFNITNLKNKFDTLDSEKRQKIISAREQAEELTYECISYINKDAEAFSSLMEAYKFPKSNDTETKNRKIAINEGLKKAMMVPYNLAEKTLKAMEYIDVAATYGNKNVVSDAGAAAICAYAAVECSIINVKVNLSYIDEELDSNVVSNCNEILTRAAEMKQIILDKVYKAIEG